MSFGYKYYYTLEECFQPSVTRPFNPINHKDSTQPNWKDVVNVFYETIPDWAKSTATDFSYQNEMWQRLRHAFDRDGIYFFVSDTEYDLTDATELAALQSECSKRARDFIETMYETKDKYVALISNQEALKTDLLASVEQTTESWFNDTPQGEDDYTATDHSTTYNKTKNSISLGPVSAKLEEVDKAMNDYYSNWTREFKKFIII